MQMVSEVMTRNVQFVSPQENLQRAAQMMDELNVGALPVCDGDHLVGMVTDRDITVRGTAAGRTPAEARVEEVMSAEVRWCFEDQSLDEVMQQMADAQIRRVPVVSHDEQHRLVGVVALGDIATRAAQGGQKQETQELVEKISTPSEPDRSQQSAGGTSAGGATHAGAGTAGGTVLGTAGAGSTGSIGEEGYEGDIGLAGVSGATSGAMGDTSESRMAGTAGVAGAAGGTDASAGASLPRPRKDTGGGGASDTIGNAPGGDIG